MGGYCSLERSLSLKRPCSSKASIRGRRGSISRRSSRSKAYESNQNRHSKTVERERDIYPGKVNEMREEAVEVGFEAHVYDFRKMGVIDVRKYPEHLLIDRLTSIVKVWWKTPFLAYPSARLTTGPRSTSRRVGHGSRKAGRRGAGSGRS